MGYWETMARLGGGALDSLGSGISEYASTKSRDEQLRLKQEQQDKENQRQAVIDQENLATGSQKYQETAAQIKAKQDFEAAAKELLTKQAGQEDLKDTGAAMGEIKLGNMAPDVPEGASTSLLTGGTYPGITESGTPHNFDQASFNPDETKRRALALGEGLGKASSDLAQAKRTDPVSQYKEATNILGHYGDLATPILGAKKDLADKQIQSETNVATNAATNQRIKEDAANRIQQEKDRLAAETQWRKDANNTAGSQKSIKLEEQQSQFNQREWDKIVKDANPLTATSRNPLGTAAKTSYNINRALQTLINPMVTNAEMGNVVADIASAYQGGTATDMAMKHQDWTTLYSTAKNILQKITGNPQDVMPDAIKKRIIDDLNGMQKTNSAVVKQQLDYTEKAKARIIKNFPEEWADMRKTIESDAYNGLDKVDGAAGKFGKSNRDVGINAPINTRTISDDDIIAKYTKVKK